MIKKEDMNLMEDVRPGRAVKCMILYFPNVEEYKICTDPFASTEKFVFKRKIITPNGNRYEDYTDIASRWIELEFSKVPF
jgi:hypothetical protein